MNKLKDKIRKFGEREEKRPVLSVVITALILEIIIEMFNQRSVVDGLCFIFKSPGMFVINTMLVMAVLSPALIFRKRRFWMLALGVVIMGMTITNFILRTYRTTPLRALDFRVAKSAATIVNMYFTKVQIILVAAGIVLVLVALVFLWFKTRKIKVKYIKSIVAIVAIVGIAWGGTAFGSSTGLIPEHFDNLTNAYVEYGFVYCFAASIFDNGISKPDTYSEENINRILEENMASGDSSSIRPNILFIQLESFFDVAKMKNFTYSEDPIPCFNALKETCPGGRLRVASFGTGTSNTEFDVLTGMNVQFFGAGEYPYSTILRKKNCDSINFHLKELGYSTHAIHDHNGNFYARNKVYPRLGFDSFDSIEYMQDVETNVLGWAKDKILIDQITETLDSTEEKDFVFAVSVQPHGRYSEEVVDENQTITLEGAETEGEKNAYEYYINQLHETDAFVGDLVETMKQRSEPTIIVFYGDHLPNIGMTDDDLIDGYDIYDSEYIIWNNFGMEIESKDLATYQLAAYVTECLGFDNWTLANLHRNNDYDSTNVDYMRDLKMVQYDVLYGKKYYYGEDGAPKKTEMKMGIHDIVIDQVIQEDGRIKVIGQNFTESSVVSVNKDRLETTFVSPNELIVEDVTLELADAVRVYQMASARSWLSKTESDVYMLGKGSYIGVANLSENDAIVNSAGHMMVDNEQ